MMFFNPFAILLLLAVDGNVGKQSTASCRITLTIPEKIVVTDVDDKPRVVSENGETELEPKLVYTLPNGTAVYVIEPM